MAGRLVTVAAATCAVLATGANAQTATVDAQTGRPPVGSLPVPLGFTQEQVLLGDRIFHGEAAGGQCSTCHGADAKGTANGNDMTTGMYIWGDGSVREIRRTIAHNMAIAPGMDGNLTPKDVDAVAAYVWALGHRRP